MNGRGPFPQITCIANEGDRTSPNYLVENRKFLGENSRLI